MTYSVRQEWHGQVLRLFVDREQAIGQRAAWEKNEAEPLRPVMHDSQNGWILYGDRTGVMIDTDGVVPKPNPMRPKP